MASLDPAGAWRFSTSCGRRAGPRCHLVPDGQHIAYTRGSDIYIASGNGTGSRKFLTVGGIPWELRWSADGKAMRFTLQDTQTNTASLWEVSADGTSLHPMLPGWNNPPAECCGNWTPDGKYFVF